MIKFWEDINRQVYNETLTWLYSYNYEYYVLFKIMYYTGCRVNELPRITIFSTMMNYTIIIPASKSSYQRSFSSVDNDWMLEFTPLQIETYIYYTTKYKLIYYCRMYFPSIDNVTPEDNISTHIFRYLLVYRLMMLEYTPEDIRLYMGQKSITSTLVYITNINSMDK